MFNALTSLTRRGLCLTLTLALSGLVAAPLVHANEETADAFIKRVSTETLPDRVRDGT